MKKIIFVLIFCLCAGTYLVACQCTVLPPLNSSSAATYDVIFTGEVLAVSGGDFQSRVRFKIRELYKGEAYQQIDVEFDGESDCGMTFAPGEVWTIYGNWVAYGIPRAEMCKHSRRFFANPKEDYYDDEDRPSYAEEQQWLKDSLGIQPYIDPSKKKDLLHKNERPDPTKAIVYLVAGLLGLVIIFYFVRRMFKRDGH
ncbi:MAG TPA: hypothetical protein VK826_02270 [Bacteroidia bacterium]|nr:hypothetical protein [Bacteroidia bacterium]